jgi:lipopolysaccharide export system ATP-binding protein
LLKDGTKTQNEAVRKASKRALDDDVGLVAHDLGKSFKGRAVVNGVSLRLKRGEVLGLLGPNGAGKTTCFYMVMGLIQPDFGTISIDGQDVTQLPMYVRARLGLGYLPQEPSIFRGMSVEDNVLAVLETVEPNARARGERCDQLLEELRIDRLRKQRSTSLSGGERRRLEIARALATDPSFILLDEPFAGIDPLAIADIRDLIGFLKHRGIGVLITDHNVRDTLNIIDRATIIFDGEVLFEGSPDEVLNQPDVRRVYLGEDFKA